MKPYRAVCFDFDYTLGDSTDSIVDGFQYGLTQMGWPKPTREEVRATIGYLLEDAYTILTGDTDPARRAQFRPLFSEIAKPRQREETVLFDGAQDLLRGIRAAGAQVSIVSTKSGDTIEYILGRYGLDHCVTTVIGTGQVKKPKPDPQGLRMALEQMGVSPEETLFCGDTVIDAETAKNAGCDFAGVLLGVTKEEAFQVWPHRYLARDLRDLARWLEL